MNRIFGKIKFNNLFYISLLISLAGIYRFSLLGRGAFSFMDEYRYKWSIMAMDRLCWAGDFHAFLSSLFEVQGRPGEALIRTIPALGQLLICSFYSIHFENPESLIIPTVFNVIISLLKIFLFYKITLILIKNNYKIALAGTLVYALLVNSNIYIRHILPYDNALLICLLSLYYYLRVIEGDKNVPLRSTCVTGLLTGLQFTVYPGYYLFPIIIFILIIFNDKEKIFSRDKLKHCFLFLLSNLSGLIFFELLAMQCKTSYLLTLLTLSDTITQGSFEEGFTFLSKYLIEVENLTGIFMLVFAVIYTVKKIKGLMSPGTSGKGIDYFRSLFFATLFCFLFQASLSAVFHKMVFYGRLVHMYIPFIIWSNLFVISEIKKDRLREITYIIMMVLSLYSFFIFNERFSAIAYPCNVLYDEGIIIQNLDANNQHYELPIYINATSPPPRNMETEAPYIKDTNFVIVNFWLYTPVTNQILRYKPEENMELIFSRPHFLTFPAYYYEGYSIEERAILKREDFHIKIYKFL